MTVLDGLTHIETVPVMEFVKMHATMAGPNHDGRDVPVVLTRAVLMADSVGL
jgi:hypothetical protein